MCENDNNPHCRHHNCQPVTPKGAIIIHTRIYIMSWISRSTNDFITSFQTPLSLSCSLFPQCWRRHQTGHVLGRRPHKTRTYQSAVEMAKIVEIATLIRNNRVSESCHRSHDVSNRRIGWKSSDERCGLDRESWIGLPIHGLVDLWQRCR